MVPISGYILTFNSSRRLEQSISSIYEVVDEIIIVDSGSIDSTREIAERFGGQFIHHSFKDFASQRLFATSQCKNDWILSIDSDEVLSPSLIQALINIKLTLSDSTIQDLDAFAIRREWYVLGKKVHSFYPSLCPDFPIRLFRKSKASYSQERGVHENMVGFKKSKIINEEILHYTCDSVEDMYGKMNLYTHLAAQDIRKKGRPSLLKVVIMPCVITLKWYIINGGWKDKIMGLILARYVYDTVYQKYLKAHYD